jgi:hypothetical protein
MARLRRLGAQQSEIRAALGMDGPLAGQALPAANRHVDINWDRARRRGKWPPEEARPSSTFTSTIIDNTPSRPAVGFFNTIDPLRSFDPTE